MDTLKALESTIGSARFWNPITLAGVSPEALEAYTRAVVIPRRGLRDSDDFNRMRVRDSEWLLGHMGEIQKHPVVERAREVGKWVSSEGAGSNSPLENRARALAYKAGLPLEMVDAKYDGAKKNFMLRSPSVTWIPAGLPADLIGIYLSDCSALTDLPEDLHCEKGEIDLSGCVNLRHIPNGLRANTLVLTRCETLASLAQVGEGVEVTYSLVLNRVPLKDGVSDEAIRAKFGPVRWISREMTR